jgi:hypothetical protein
MKTKVDTPTSEIYNASNSHFPDSEQTIKTKNGGVKLVLWTQTLSWQNDAVMQIISTCENYTNNNIQNG